MIIETSPTNFNPDRMPNMVQSNVFTCAKQQAYSNRVTTLEQCNSNVKELMEMEAERRQDESGDEYSREIREELADDMKKIKTFMEAQTLFSHNLGLMASYIIDIRKEVPLEADHLKKDAKEELDKSTKDDKVLRDTVSSWKRDNRKWLMRPRKCEKSKERGEPSKTNSGKDSWLENLVRDLKPTKNLRDDGYY